MEKSNFGSQVSTIAGRFRIDENLLDPALTSTYTLDMSTPSDEDKEEIFLSCRYGDLEEVQDYIQKFGAESLSEIRDGNNNTVLHMISGNGHTGEPRISIVCINEDRDWMH